LIPCCAQTDTAKKFCFTSNEINYFVGAAYDAEAYKQVTDSLRMEIANLETISENNSQLVEGCRELVEEKNKAIQASSELNTEYKKQLEVETRKKILWKRSAFLTGGILSGILIIKTIIP
jgi:hypothetical protein